MKDEARHAKVAHRPNESGKEDAAVAKPAKASFDTLGFLAKVGTGKTIQNFRKNENVFAQGDVADTVFYVQKASSLSCPNKARKLSLRSWSPASSSAKVA